MAGIVLFLASYYAIRFVCLIYRCWPTVYTQQLARECRSIQQEVHGLNDIFRVCPPVAVAHRDGVVQTAHPIVQPPALSTPDQCR